VSFVDNTALENLKELSEEVAKIGKHVILCNLNDRVQAAMKNAGLDSVFNAQNQLGPTFADSISEAVRRANIIFNSRHKSDLAKTTTR
jgi:anti-anti-sigma regulatory factor